MEEGCIMYKMYQSKLESTKNATGGTQFQTFQGLPNGTRRRRVSGQANFYSRTP